MTIKKIILTYSLLGIFTNYVQYLDFNFKQDIIREQLNSGRDCSRYYNLNREHCDKLRNQLQKKYHFNAVSILTFPNIWFKYFFQD
jgi:hypothetical protein